MTRSKHFIPLIAGLFLSTAAFSRDEADDQTIRENPEIEVSQPDKEVVDSVDLSVYPFLNTNANVIALNGADWSGLTQALSETEDRVLRIVHIGDSHIQADLGTGFTRRLMQQRFGSAGRGLVVPLKLAGTNEPRDYIIRSTSTFDCEKLLTHSWTLPMGFTGISVSPKEKDFDFTLSAHEPFERIYIYYTGSALNVMSVEYDDTSLVYAVNDEVGCVCIGLPFPCEEVTVNLSSFGDIAIHGMELVSDMIGVAYHTIGINGATYSCYNRVADFGRSIAMLEPQLIIVSLGTNEAFGKLDSSEFVGQVDALVSELQANNPEACIMLTTPAECQRRMRKRRKSSYAVNENVVRVRDLIAGYGVSNGIAVYDWYEAAGGDGSSNNWINAGLFSHDRIHCSVSGYEVTGQMLYNALINTLANNEVR